MRILALRQMHVGECAEPDYVLYQLHYIHYLVSPQLAKGHHSIISVCCTGTYQEHNYFSQFGHPIINEFVVE